MGSLLSLLKVARGVARVIAFVLQLPIFMLLVVGVRLDRRHMSDAQLAAALCGFEPTLRVSPAAHRAGPTPTKRGVTGTVTAAYLSVAGGRDGTSARTVPVLSLLALILGRYK